MHWMRCTIFCDRRVEDLWILMVLLQGGVDCTGDGEVLISFALCTCYLGMVKFCLVFIGQWLLKLVQ